MSSRRNSITERIIFTACAVTACWIIIRTFATPPIGSLSTSSVIVATGLSSGCHGDLDRCICLRETCCADSVPTIFLFVISRGSGYASYPLIYVLFLSKAHNIRMILQRSILREWFNFLDLNRIHKVTGKALFGTAMLHGTCHLVRWGIRDVDIRFVWTNQTGVTGLVAFLTLPMIVIPMLTVVRPIISTWEYRKALHYLSWLFGVALMFHAPAMNIAWLIAVPFFIYLFDWIFGFYARTFLIDSATFHCINGQARCVVMSIDKLNGFDDCGVSMVYVMLPHISLYQWHPFSILPINEEFDNKKSYMCIIAASGDWTDQLYRETLQQSEYHSGDCSRVAYIYGPILQTHQLGVYFDHIISICSGVGVTSALSFYTQYAKTSRLIYLVWICRDWGLIHYVISFLKQVTINSQHQNDSVILIYYTGHDEEQAFLEYNSLANTIRNDIFVFRGRPALERVIFGIECIHKNKNFGLNIPQCYSISMIIPQMNICDTRLVAFEVLFGHRRLSGKVSQEHDIIGDAQKNKQAFEKWQIIYCGGSEAIVRTLQEAKLKYNFELIIEELGW